MDEEYEAAAWLTTLKVMQRVGEKVHDTTYVAGRLCTLVHQKPDQFYDRFVAIADKDTIEESVDRRFLRELGVIQGTGKIARGLCDAAALLCTDDIAQYVKQDTTFSRLVPLIDELADYCTEKHLTDLSHQALKQLGFSSRFYYTKIDADFYIREYDRPETVDVTLVNGLI